MAGGVATATAGTITGLGFTGSGIAAGSIAAGIQAGIGNIAAGSTFAVVQSLGATGAVAALGVAGGVGLAIGGLGLLGYKVYQTVWGREEEEKREEGSA